MGFLKNLTGKQLADVIEWADMDENTLFYKWNNDEIKKGSRLIIRPAQDAIFLYQGRVEGVFTEEGDYDIESKIIPFLSTLFGFKFGFNSGLRAEVLFINTREFNVQWGTANALNLPVAGLPGGMPVRAYGLFTCRVSDYGVLIDKIAGVSKTFTVEDIKTRIGAQNDQLLMKWIVKEGKDMFNIQANAFDISQGIKEDLNGQLNEIGLECTSYNIQSVSYPESVKEMQEKAAGASMVGDVNAYTQVQMANNFGNGGGSSTASDMAQMAAGLALGQQMVNNMQGGAAAAPQPQAPVPPVAPAAPVQPEAAAAEAEKTVQEVFEELKGPNFCPYCGKQVNGANYCPYCGKKLI
ncbi:MAG: SPFH domain-containing protein [Lachnospiraceae bacterium]|nr:SPFH domain-containing protein [Lachnospiraceae bacterium]